MPNYSLLLITFILYRNVVANLSSKKNCDMCICHTDDKVLILNCSDTKTRPGDYYSMIRIPYPESYDMFSYETVEAHFERSRIKILTRLSFDKITSLYLGQNEITATDSETFVRLRTLKTLSLTDNKLHIVGEKTFNGLSKLEILDLSHNELENLPSGTFSALRSLKTLCLSHNVIESLEGEVFAVSTLETLDVSFNSILKIESNVFKNAASLRTLNFSNNKITTIENYGISSLETLDLSFNENVTMGANVFSDWKNLKWFSLSSNNLEEVPLGVQMLAELRVLHLDRNVIKDLGDPVKKLQLVELYVQNNNLQTVEVDGSRLRVLNLSTNSLTSFGILENSALEVLDLSRNQLRAVPDTLTGLQMPALRWLNLDNNPMKQVNFPTAEKEERDGELFVNLTWVSVSHMRALEQLEAGAFSGLASPCGECRNEVQKTSVQEAELVQECSRRLKIRVAHNPVLVKIDAEAFKDVGMCSLDLSYNALSFLDEEVTPWETLEAADLQGNPWDCTCRMQWMLDKVLPRIYNTSAELLYELRCNTPVPLRNKRLVHFFNWEKKAFCSEMEQIRVATESVDMNVTIGSSKEFLYVAAGLGTVGLFLVIAAVVMQRRFDQKNRSRNRRF